MLIVGSTGFAQEVGVVDNGKVLGGRGARLGFHVGGGWRFGFGVGVFVPADFFFVGGFMSA